MAGKDGSPTGDGPTGAEVPRPVILFDGVCNLCNAAVRWVVERDLNGRFDFASLQSEAARDRLSGTDPPTDVHALPDSIVLIDGDGSVHMRSSAAIGIARELGFPWSLFAVVKVVPRPLRDAVYRFVARNRYRWFGRRDTCSVPAPDVAARFLDADELRNGDNREQDAS